MAGEYDRPFGKPEAIEKRLAMWSRQLGQDKRYPWVGVGIIDDLMCAATMLGYDGITQAKPAEHPSPCPQPPFVAPAPIEDDEFAQFHAAKAAQEYDL